MSKKKTIAVAIVLALILLIGGMLAYFTDTDSKTNNFTLADKVDIAIDETWTPADGQNIVPGAVITKAPSIKNNADSAAAYVFAEVTVPCYDEDGDGTVETPLFGFIDANGDPGTNAGWTLIDTKAINTTAKTITYVYAYGSDSAMTRLAVGATTTTPVFTKVKLDKDLTATQRATAPTATDIVVNAKGIQADGLEVTAPTAILGLIPNN